MKAVITAGGKGRRIASLFPDIPKPMICIAGKPVLLHTVEALRESGVTDIIITLGYKSDVIKSYFSDGRQLGVNVSYFEETEPLGNAGALLKMKDRLTENFLLINGDLIFDIDFGRLLDFHKSHGGTVTLFTHPNSHPYDSTVIFCDDNGRAAALYDSGEVRPEYVKNRVNAGIHVLSPEALSVTSKDKVNLDTDIIKPLIKSGKVFCYDSTEYVRDMGTQERFAAVERDVISLLPQKRNLKNKQKAIFLDRDGTLNRYDGFITKAERLVLNENAAQAVKMINESGYLAVVITNQPVIARGEATTAQLEEIHNRLETLLGDNGAYLDGIFYCPHHPDGGFAGEVKELKTDCLCRKPKPGLFFTAAEKFNIDLSSSFMIGDSENDMKAAENAGCRGIKISTDGDILRAVKTALTDCVK